ncbi:MAG: PilT/PilU family type 4a pilus ATPase [Calditrichaeota bacterium]|nr:PilT/PilU family type 4a pilus ATPase [Calditrichota bacterium]
MMHNKDIRAEAAIDAPHPVSQGFTPHGSGWEHTTTHVRPGLTSAVFDESRDIDRFLKRMVELRGSDLHIKSGSSPKVRIDGQITDLSRELLTPQAVDAILMDVISEREREALSRQMEVDFIYQLRGIGRFRVNVYQQMNGIAIAIRHIRVDIPSLPDLNLPPILAEMVDSPRGLILVTGATGSGKSTTLAAMVETLNQSRAVNIITVEDPIEFTFKERKATIQQREIGRDTPSWSEALRRILRQDPDVIMLGEIRDGETMLTALTAANTGHLVLSTLHTMDAAQTVNRIISMVPMEMSNQVRYMLAATLVGIVSQRLLPRADGEGRIPAVEILVTTETIRKMIIDPEQTLEIRRAIFEGYGQYGMQTFDQSLLALVRAGRISLEDGLRFASSATDFRIRLRGLDGAGAMAWNEDDVVPTHRKAH